MRRAAFEQGISEPRYDVRHQWAGNGRGKVTAVVLGDNGGHLPVGELSYRTAHGRAEVEVSRVDVHPEHQGRELEQRMLQRLRADYPEAQVR